MPFRGIVLILIATITVCLFCKDEIYKEVKKFFKEDEGEKEE